MLKPLLVYFTFSLIWTTNKTEIDEQRDIYLINPNYASQSALYAIPLLTEDEVYLIIKERNIRKFKNMDDLTSRIHLMPYEANYLSSYFTFRQRCSHLYFRLKQDVYFYYNVKFKMDKNLYFTAFGRKGDYHGIFSFNAYNTSLTIGNFYYSDRGGLFDKNALRFNRNIPIHRDTSGLGIMLSYRKFCAFYKDSLYFASAGFNKYVGVNALFSKNEWYGTAFYIQKSNKRMLLYSEQGVRNKNVVAYSEFRLTYPGLHVYGDVFSRFDTARLNGADLRATLPLYKQVSLYMRSSLYAGNYNRRIYSAYLFKKFFVCRISVGLKKSTYSDNMLVFGIKRARRPYVSFRVAKSLTAGAYYTYITSALGPFEIKYFLSNRESDIYYDNNYYFYTVSGKGERWSIIIRHKVKNYRFYMISDVTNGIVDVKGIITGNFDL